MKKADIWGQCKYSILSVNATRGGRTNFRVECSKSGRCCDPNYCLGPDEDGFEKGEKHENED